MAEDGEDVVVVLTSPLNQTEITFKKGANTTMLISKKLGTS